jgi:hypothetical protein
MHSLATAISGKIRKLDRLDATSHVSVTADFRDSGEGVELRAPAPPDELESLLEERPLEELERLLREHFLGPAGGPMDNQEYHEFVAILEDTRTRIETVFSELPISGATKARLKRVVADLARAAQTYRDKSNTKAR